MSYIYFLISVWGFFVSTLFPRLNIYPIDGSSKHRIVMYVVYSVHSQHTYFQRFYYYFVLCATCMHYGSWQRNIFMNVFFLSSSEVIGKRKIIFCFDLFVYNTRTSILLLIRHKVYTKPNRGMRGWTIHLKENYEHKIPPKWPILNSIIAWIKLKYV